MRLILSFILGFFWILECKSQNYSEMPFFWKKPFEDIDSHQVKVKKELANYNGNWKEFRRTYYNYMGGIDSLFRWMNKETPSIVYRYYYKDFNPIKLVATYSEDTEWIEWIRKKFDNFINIKPYLPYDITYSYLVTPDSFFVSQYYENKFVQKIDQGCLNNCIMPVLCRDTLVINDSLIVRDSCTSTKTYEIFNISDTILLLKKNNMVRKEKTEFIEHYFYDDNRQLREVVYTKSNNNISRRKTFETLHWNDTLVNIEEMKLPDGNGWDYILKQYFTKGRMIKSEKIEYHDQEEYLTERNYNEKGLVSKFISINSGKVVFEARYEYEYYE